MTLIGDQEQSRAGILRGATAASALSKMDIVYVVRHGEQNQNLKYSLRSIANLPHGRVYIAGYCPSWVSEDVIEVFRDQTDLPDQENSNANLLAAALCPDLSDDFIFFNDDFIVLEPISELPYRHQGLIDDRIETYQLGNRMMQAFSLMATRQELRKILPSTELYSYELHMPMILNKQKVKSMFDYWERTKRPLASLRPRSFYGNLYQVKGDKTDDAKTSSGEAGAQKGFLSTVHRSTDTAAGSDGTWDYIKQRFPAAGAYESGA